MTLTNINIYTVFIFIAGVSGVIYLFYLFYKRKERLSKQYNFLGKKINFTKYFLLILSFIVALFGTFHLK
jgi:Golgi nucleoside diphosphatase